MSERSFYTATRKPNEVFWRPVTERKVIDIDGNPRMSLTLKPGQHVELMTPEGQWWANDPEQFVRNHRLKGKALQVFKDHYPDVEIPE